MWTFVGPPRSGISFRAGSRGRTLWARITRSSPRLIVIERLSPSAPAASRAADPIGPLRSAMPMNQ